MTQATRLLLHGCTDRQAREMVKAWREQGPPTLNRADRRKSGRVGEQARRARKKTA